MHCIIIYLLFIYLLLLLLLPFYVRRNCITILFIYLHLFIYYVICWHQLSRRAVIADSCCRRHDTIAPLHRSPLSNHHHTHTPLHRIADLLPPCTSWLTTVCCHHRAPPPPSPSPPTPLSRRAVSQLLSAVELSGVAVFCKPQYLSFDFH